MWLVALLGATLLNAALLPGDQAEARQAAGTIVGRVRLAGEAPANPVVRMGVDPACSRAHGTTRPVHDFVVRSAAGGLANVFVEVRGPFPGAPVPETPIVLDQQGCMFRPRLLAVQKGQRLEVRNADPTMHNVHALSERGNTFNVSQVMGRPPFTVVLAHEEKMLRITCDLHHWMNVYVAVVAHPYFAITGSDGAFVIRGVPAGRHAVQVWHERYGPLTATVDVSPGGSARADFSFTGSEQAAPPLPGGT